VLVQFLVDGATVGNAAAAPYRFVFDTTHAANGSHVFAAKAWDAAGNLALSSVVTAIVSNPMTMSKRPSTPGNVRIQ
jgi:hypothetical protein